MVERKRSREGAERLTEDVTQTGVARAAGVNRATVSRALDPARRHLVNAETAARIEQIAAELGYRPNALARGLKTRRSGVIGLVISAALAPFAEAALVRAIEESLARSGHFALVIHQPEEPAASEHPTVQAAQGLIDGAIVVSTRDPSTADAGARPAIPLVTLGFAPSRHANIVLDEAAGAARALHHLARMGHRRIAIISEPPGSPRGEVFLDTYRQTCKELFGAVDEDLIESYLPSRPASGPDACRALFYRGANPTAIFATDDAAAMACYGTVRQFGLTVGREISVVGMGNTPPAAFIEPPLTTVALPLSAAGAAAADLLLTRIRTERHGYTRARPRVFEPYLLQRMSTVAAVEPGAVLPACPACTMPRGARADCAQCGLSNLHPRCSMVRKALQGCGEHAAGRGSRPRQDRAGPAG
jgi:LacI family transcriptional regulator